MSQLILTPMEKLIKTIINLLRKQSTAVCNGAYICTPADDVNLPQPGYFEVASDGDVHATTVNGEDITVTVTAGVCSRFRVKKIFDDATTASGIIIYW